MTDLRAGGVEVEAILRKYAGKAIGNTGDVLDYAQIIIATAEGRYEDGTKGLHAGATMRMLQEQCFFETTGLYPPDGM